MYPHQVTPLPPDIWPLSPSEWDNRGWQTAYLVSPGTPDAVARPVSFNEEWSGYCGFRACATNCGGAVHRPVGPEGYSSVGDMWVGFGGLRDECLQQYVTVNKPAADDIYVVTNACLEQCQQTPQFILREEDRRGGSWVPQVFTVGVGQIGVSSPDNYGVHKCGFSG